MGKWKVIKVGSAYSLAPSWYKGRKKNPKCECGKTLHTYRLEVAEDTENVYERNGIKYTYVYGCERCKTVERD